MSTDVSCLYRVYDVFGTRPGLGILEREAMTGIEIYKSGTHWRANPIRVVSVNVSDDDHRVSLPLGISLSHHNEVDVPAVGADRGAQA